MENKNIITIAILAMISGSMIQALPKTQIREAKREKHEEVSETIQESRENNRDERRDSRHSKHDANQYYKAENPDFTHKEEKEDRRSNRKEKHSTKKSDQKTKRQSRQSIADVQIEGRFNVEAAKDARETVKD